MVEVYRISWPEVMQMVAQLTKKLSGRHVWGIPRGGLFVATLLAYRGNTLAAVPGSADWFVDDIADTGGTCINNLRAYQGLPTAAMVVRRDCDPLPTFWVMMLDIEDYILFPWEDEQEALEHIRKKANQKQT